MKTKWKHCRRGVCMNCERGSVVPVIQAKQLRRIAWPSGAQERLFKKTSPSEIRKKHWQLFFYETTRKSLPGRCFSKFCVDIQYETDVFVFLLTTKIENVSPLSAVCVSVWVYLLFCCYVPKGNSWLRLDNNKTIIFCFLHFKILSYIRTIIFL